jgi:hypothetical protein
MPWLLRVDLAAALGLIVGLVVSVSACRQSDAGDPPTIVFDRVPPATTGGPERLTTISGRVTGARPGQQIVLFAKSGIWWVQPFTAQPFTKIEADRTWKNRVHFGTEYGALLVERGYQPPDTIEVLPAPGGPVIAAATVPGTPSGSPLVHKRLTFSGYDWDVRETPSDRGGLNDYDPANAWTDANGFLHLKLARRDGRWTSAEVILTRGLGYGTYVFVVSDTSHLEPAATVGFFTYDEAAAGANHREMDIEITRWGDPKLHNAQYTVQPYYVPANVVRFSAPSGVLTHSLRWEPGRATFTTARGRGPTTTAVVTRHEFAAGVPTPGTERVRMNLYYFRYGPMQPEKEVEVVIEKFQYLP